MKDIQKIHEDVFAYLNSWSEQARTAKDEINPFFYMRSVRDQRFEKGYWFPGDETSLCISFWAGGDSYRKTPNIYFEINERKGCRIIIVARDSDEKYEYFEKMVSVLNKVGELKFVVNQRHKVWVKEVSEDFNDWHNALGSFIANDKIKIDSFITENKLTDVDEFVSIFGFITPPEFDVMYSRVMVEKDTINEEKKKKNLPTNHDTVAKLPFALLDINIENFQGVKSMGISELSPDARWIFVTGENGYGKTTFLQSIALGLSQDPELEKYLDEKTRISTKVTAKLWSFFQIKSKGNINNPHLKDALRSSKDYSQYVLGYGPARLNIQSQTSENMESRSHNNVLSLFENDTLLKSINYELFASNHSDSETFEELKEIVKAVTDGRVSEIEVRDREVFFTEKLSNSDELEPLPLSKLAAGFRSIINIVFDIYLRLKDTHPNTKYADFYGIVLIDEIENHLHPILQRDLPGALSKVFPKIQFIVSTHSPIPLLAAERNSIIIKVNRTKELGVTLERLDETIDFPTLLPNTILTSPIFGFQDIFSDSKEKEKFVRVETTYAEVLNNDRQKELIESHLDKETTASILELLRK
jgi:predicted ATP-binding protein involved in virulence